MGLLLYMTVTASPFERQRLPGRTEGRSLCGVTRRIGLPWTFRGPRDIVPRKLSFFPEGGGHRVRVGRVAGTGEERREAHGHLPPPNGLSPNDCAVVDPLPRNAERNMTVRTAGPRDGFGREVIISGAEMRCQSLTELVLCAVSVEVPGRSQLMDLQQTRSLTHSKTRGQLPPPPPFVLQLPNNQMAARFTLSLGMVLNYTPKWSN